ncbi:uncharacterized protein VNE69_07289 [Vairimorpha necatrix]|uniref:Uncharacterized protein n=1 Tax=Vairimorpha necatrix TaxID=6039 RepID=A0AAX4JE78_9MICR
MEKYLNEFLGYGLYGTNLNRFNEEEIRTLCVDDSYEIYYTKDKEKLEKNLNGETIIKLTDFNTIMTDLNSLNIRVKYNIFKQNLAQYKWKEEYPYKVIDYLLNADEYVKSSELREKLNLDSKRIFYVTKILKRSEVLEQKREGSGVYYFKLDKKLLFKYENPTNDNYDTPMIPENLCTEIPLLDQIRNLIKNSPVGITTEDVKKNFGMSIRQGLNYLTKINELDREQYLCKEIFIGKIRRLLFFVSTDVVEKKKFTDKKFITVEDRMNALDQMLQDKKGFVITDESLRQFQINLNTNFLPCKKTIMSTALKCGHKIFTIKEKNECKTLIIHKDVNVVDYLNETEDRTQIEFKNSTEENLYNKFVLARNFIIKDNYYITNEKEKIRLLCDYLHNKNEDNYIILDENFFLEMNLKFLFKIIPIDILNVMASITQDCKFKDLKYDDLLNKLKRSNVTKNLKISITIKRILKKILDLEKIGLIEKYTKKENLNEEKANEYIINEQNANKSGLNKETVKDSKLLKDIEQNSKLNQEGEKIFKKTKLNENGEKNMKKLVDENYSINTTKDLVNKNTDREKVKDLLSNLIIIKLCTNYNELIDNIPTKNKKNVYMNYVNRIKCFNYLRYNKKATAYKIIKKFIKQNYTNIYKELMKYIDEAFGNMTEEEQETCAEPPNTQEFLYTKIKYDLLYNDLLNPLEYKDYSNIELILEKLREDGIVVCNERKITVQNCRIKSRLKYKLMKHLEIQDTRMQEYLNRDTIYKIYFVLFYEILVKTGSMEMNELLEKVKVCKDFEFINFCKIYSDVFEINDVDDLRIVSVNIEIDPLEFM